MQIFSFCIYGSAPKYCKGLLKNLELIRDQFSEFETWIAVGDDVPDVYKTAYASFPRVRLIPFECHDGRLMSYRFFFVDEPEVDCMIVRDADSRITPRDAWCIHRFLQTSSKEGYRIFTIRDHRYHGREIMGGQWGMFKIHDLSLRSTYAQFQTMYGDLAGYNSDQEFLKRHLYIPYKHLCVAYTSGHVFPNEHSEPISVERSGPHDFCGNVIEYNEKGEEYYGFVFW